MIDLSRYVFQPLCQDEEFILYRGRSQDDPDQVLVLSPAVEHPRPESLRRLEHEYSLRGELDPTWAARSIEITHHRDRTALVMEDPGGMPLDRLLVEPLALGLWLRLAIGLSSALNHLHQRGIIHKDIKPANVLADSVTGQCWLHGFLISLRLPRERQLPHPPEFIVGTLPYLAPEQTGRMNRSVDSRSDLYALGVTLYQMLTGNLPFAAADPMEWVHCHIARQPVPPEERRNDVPSIISAIILRLLSKTAEERYQTAAGLAADLRKCLAEWESRDRISWFLLGADDISDRFLIPEKLYGRDREIKTLLEAFDQVITSGKPSLVLISGYSGIGKSSVVNELHKVLVSARGLFASGKFDQYKRDIPYATLVQAFQSLVVPLLSKSEAELQTWREAIRSALGPNGQLMVDLIPELKLIIGEQLPVPHLPPKAARWRFHLVFRRFIEVFARPDHPLALFLDDLQWLDAATLDFVEHLLTSDFADEQDWEPPEPGVSAASAEPLVRTRNLGVQHLMLVGAYRDNEVDFTHPLWRRLEAIKQSGAMVHEIVLAPLRRDDLAHMIVDCLHCGQTQAIPLALLVHDKTAGNPFFTVQFISALAEEGLLTFDREALRWFWDLDRIHAKRYTDNVVNLMVGKLSRLPGQTRDALQQLACLGNIAETRMLSAVLGTSEAALDLELWEAVRAGLVFREAATYEFLHDRIQQAAYTLIPEDRRGEVHLRISRVLLASMTADELDENLFDVANQFNRSATHLLGSDEKEQLATVDLRAGRKAKAAAAYASANRYFEAGVALLDEGTWRGRYDLMFNLLLERAECELLTGNLQKADQLIAEILQRATSKVDQAAGYHLKVLLHTVKSENAQAVETALTSLGLLGIEIPARPSQEQVESEYATLWRNLDGHPIETLIELPLMNDQVLRSAMQVLSTALGAAYFTDMQLFSLLACRMANLSRQHGVCGASAHGFAYLGGILGPVFHLYTEGYRFAKLACDLVDKHAFIAYQAKVYHAMAIVAIWTDPIATVIDSNQAAFRAATETGDLTSACYCMSRSVTFLLLRNDPLEVVWRESERSLEFARKAGFRDTMDRIISQQRFIAAMQGRTSALFAFGDAEFDESTFEAELSPDRTALVICFYWIIKLQAAFLAGDYRAALVAANKAKDLLWSSVAHIQMLDYFYYTALTVAAVYEDAALSKQAEWRRLLKAHQEQLREWADNYASTFADKYALVSAEIARIEERDIDAMRLYEEAIRAARESGFVQNEGIGNEVAARFYLRRGFDRIGKAYLRDARHCYLRWGALGKVQQLDQSYPALEEQGSRGTLTAISAPVEQLDLGAVFKASQAVSSEIIVERLVETLLNIALQQAGAERGLLILQRGLEQQIVAEAKSLRDKVAVEFRQSLPTSFELPESLLRYVARTHESVILDDASTENLFSEDQYVRRQHPRSVLCLPLVKQAQLVGVLYLENNLAPHAFTAQRLAMLELLASQAAISLDNARLYADLVRENEDRKKVEEALRVSEERWSRLAENSSAGIALLASDGRFIAANEALQKMLGYTATELQARTVLDITYEEDRAATKTRMTAAYEGQGRIFRFEKRYVRKDTSLVWADVSNVFVAASGNSRAFHSTVIVDITERKRTEEELRQKEVSLREAQAALAHVSRVTTMGELAASIAHEVNQPLSGIVGSAGAGLRWLASDSPDIVEAQAAFRRIVRDGKRTADVVSRMRALFKKADAARDRLDMNEAILEVVSLTHSEALRNKVDLRTELAADLPAVMGDRVQLQQVMVNLILNAIEAMHTVEDGGRDLLISTQQDDGDEIQVAVRDSGIGFDPLTAERIFAAFHTTKPGGLGMGLSISRSIVESHGGRLWAEVNDGPGATFRFTLLRCQ